MSLFLAWISENRMAAAVVAALAGGLIAAVLTFSLIGWYLWVAVEQAHAETLRAVAAREEKERQFEEKDRMRDVQLEHFKGIAEEAEKRAARDREVAQAALRQRTVIQQNRDREVRDIASRSDTELAGAISTLARQVYPDIPISVLATARGATIDRGALQVYNRSLVDVRAGREMLEEVVKANGALGNERDAYKEAGQAKDQEIAALNERVEGMEGVLASVRDERDAFEKELKAVKRKSKWKRVGGYALKAGVFVAGVFIGRNL